MLSYLAVPTVFNGPSRRFTMPLLALQFARRLSRRYGGPRLTLLRAFRPGRMAA